MTLKLVCIKFYWSLNKNFLSFFMFFLLFQIDIFPSHSISSNLGFPSAYSSQTSPCRLPLGLSPLCVFHQKTNLFLKYNKIKQKLVYQNSTKHTNTRKGAQKEEEERAVNHLWTQEPYRKNKLEAIMCLQRTCRKKREEKNM